MKRVACVVLCLLLAGCSSIGGIGAEISDSEDRISEGSPAATDPGSAGEATATPQGTATSTQTAADEETPTDTPDQRTRTPNRTARDSDGDGLSDPREAELGTNPRVADTDGDGLNDSRELAVGTSPLRADTDADSLNDSAELEHGTDPTDADTDGDTLKDGWEVRNRAPNGTALPSADPLRKDIYVTVSYAADSRELRERQVNEVRGAFKNMDVSNPDGSTGISVHVENEYNRVSITQEYTNGDEALEAARQHSNREQLGNKTGLYHHVILMDISDDADFDVVAQQPGHVVAVDEDELATRGGGIQYRSRLIIWGLLRNTAGDVDSPHEGWWARERDHLWAHTYLPDPVAERFEQNGFANRTADSG